MKVKLFIIGIACVRSSFDSTCRAQLAPPEGGPRVGTIQGRDKMIAEINTDIEQCRLQQGWDQNIASSQLEQARPQSFLLWCSDHRADPLGDGSQFSEIKNAGIQSNLGVLNLDWLATFGNTWALLHARCL
jgi:hypothetical protein